VHEGVLAHHRACESAGGCQRQGAGALSNRRGWVHAVRAHRRRRGLRQRRVRALRPAGCGGCCDTGATAARGAMRRAAGQRHAVLPWRATGAVQTASSAAPRPPPAPGARATGPATAAATRLKARRAAGRRRALRPRRTPPSTRQRSIVSVAHVSIMLAKTALGGAAVWGEAQSSARALFARLARCAAACSAQLLAACHARPCVSAVGDSGLVCGCCLA